MGNVRSEPHESPPDIWWTPPSTPSPDLETFKVELAAKREQRKRIIAEKRNEMNALRDENERLREAHRTALEEFEHERSEYANHVTALKDVIGVSKQMLMIRETQLGELRRRISEIETSLSERMSQDLRGEYERQLQNIRNLRVFYEERQRADRKEKEEMKEVLEETKRELEAEKKKNVELEENLARLEEENSKKYDEIKGLESNLGLTKAECRQYEAELAVINQLFSQILFCFNNNQEMDFDKLIKLLEENHHLLQTIAVQEDSTQVSALPKVLLDLINKINDDSPQPLNPETQISSQLNSASDIVENLPKVWKVLIELLSHQCGPERSLETVPETPLVLSVSQTFIRLKDLILEKKSLERETCRLKHLNTHLESRMQEQEKRLELVAHELADTWHVVGKLQKKHQLLHTQEKILRYELAQKRKLLVELRTELEESRGKWLEAREKNSTTEKQWNELRSEFAQRKRVSGDVESGYSDDKESSEESDGEDREKRLARLEEQGKELLEKVTKTVGRSGELERRLDELHEAHGGASE